MASGTCTCDAGFVGDDCGRSVAIAPSAVEPVTLCPSACSGHGRCQPDGSCVCHDGFVGDACDQLKRPARAGGSGAAACPKGCGGHGLCDHTTGLCRCVAGFGGDACDRVVPTPECEHNCSGHGTCSPDAAAPPGAAPQTRHLHAGCACRKALQYAWEGASCDRLAIPDGCPNGCSGQGTCVTLPGRRREGSGGSAPPGHCVCRFGFSGSDCSVASACPARCNGRGDCVAGRCECERGWKGTACQEPRCAGDCSGHGECLPPMGQGALGTCLCAGGWAGMACDVWRPHCPNGCSGHGACVAGRCACESGFVGDGCEARKGAAPAASLALALGEHSCGRLLCGGHGACVHGRADDTVLCACFDGYGGPRCQSM